MPKYFCFEVRLLNVPTRLRRLFLVDSRETFWDLHLAIQDACGWEDSHLFVFRTPRSGRVIAGVPEDGMGDTEPDATLVKLASYFKPKKSATCLYLYDFGDDWQHEVLHMDTVALGEHFSRRLLDGEGTFPPEDCGGESGYERCLAASTGRGWTEAFGTEDDRAELLEWLEDWRPDRFDLERARKEFDE